jgi:hypothetical protein
MGGSGKKVEYEAKVDDEAFGGRYDAKKTFDNLEDAFKFLEKNKGIRSSNTVESDVADGAYETNLGSVTVIEDGKEVGASSARMGCRLKSTLIGSRRMNRSESQPPESSWRWRQR